MAAALTDLGAELVTPPHGGNILTATIHPTEVWMDASRLAGTKADEPTERCCLWCYPAKLGFPATALAGVLGAAADGAPGQGGPPEAVE
jgi:hypothetical protein